jgi:hypothetical protein
MICSGRDKCAGVWCPHRGPHDEGADCDMRCQTTSINSFIKCIAISILLIESEIEVKI